MTVFQSLQNALIGCVLILSTFVIKIMILDNITKHIIKQDTCFGFMGTFISSIISVTLLMFASCLEGRKRRRTPLFLCSSVLNQLLAGLVYFSVPYSEPSNHMETENGSGWGRNNRSSVNLGGLPIGNIIVAIL